MKKILIQLVLIICLIGCKKKNEEAPNNNEFNATVVLSSGGTVNIQVRGLKVDLGSGGFAGITWVSGTDENNAVVVITIYPHITNPGTYSFDCEYRPNNLDLNAPIYGGTGSNITFTTITDKRMEGFFTAVVCNCVTPVNCNPNSDSVTITGNFKGERRI